MLSSILRGRCVLTRLPRRMSTSTWNDLPDSTPKPRDEDTVDLFASVISSSLKPPRPASNAPRSRALLFPRVEDEDMAKELLDAMKERYQGIISTRTVIKRDGKYAFIEFDTPQHARKAYKAYEKDPIISARQNRTLQLVYSNASTYMRPPVTPTDTLFVGSIPYSTNPGLLIAHFEKFGTLSRTYAKPAKDTSAPGYMNIQFADQAAAVSAFEECRDNPLRVRVSTDNVELGLDPTDDDKYTVHTLFVDYQQPQRAPEGPPSRNLHFTGWTRGPRELKTWLYKELRSGVDEVMNIKFVRDSKTPKQTTGFIEVVSLDAAKRVRALAGKRLGDCTFDVHYALKPLYGTPRVKDSLPIHPTQLHKMYTN